MQIKEKGNRVQLIRTEYIPEKKRTVGRIIATFDRYETTFPVDICRQVEEKGFQQISDEERQQVEQWIVDNKEKRSVDSLSLGLSLAASNINRATQALAVDELADRVTPEQAQAIFSAVDALKKALRKRGYRPAPKPAKQSKPKPADNAQADLLAGAE